MEIAPQINKFILEPLSLEVGTGLAMMLRAVGTPIERRETNAHHLYDATLKFSGRSAIAARMPNNAPGFLFCSQLFRKHKTISVGAILLAKLKLFSQYF